MLLKDFTTVLPLNNLLVTSAFAHFWFEFCSLVSDSAVDYLNSEFLQCRKTTSEPTYPRKKLALQTVVTIPLLNPSDAT